MEHVRITVAAVTPEQVRLKYTPASIQANMTWAGVPLVQLYRNTSTVAAAVTESADVDNVTTNVGSITALLLRTDTTRRLTMSEYIGVKVGVGPEDTLLADDGRFHIF